MKILASIIFSLGLVACVTGEKAREVRPGMSQDQVVSVMGSPDGFQQRGEYTLYQYTNRLISGWSWDKTDYTFIFKENRLIEYGPGEVRERDVGGIHTIFLHQY